MTSTSQHWKSATPFGEEAKSDKTEIAISDEAKLSLDHISSSFGLTSVEMLERLIYSAERVAVETAKSVPNGGASLAAKELKFSDEQQQSILTIVAVELTLRKIDLIDRHESNQQATNND